MEITHKDITDFQQLYEQKFGQLLNLEVAEEKLLLLVRQVQITYSPISFSELDSVINTGTRNEQ